MRLAAAALLAFAWLAGAAAAEVCSPDRVDLRTPAGGTARFSVEIADTPASRAQGLMNRPQMATAAGMLFVFEAPQTAAFWMKNTLIPLDMIFLDQTGTVTHVHANARPRDETPIPGGDGVLAVLEINGGLSARLGIAPGTVMRHPAFAPDTAAWSCLD